MRARRRREFAEPNQPTALLTSVWVQWSALLHTISYVDCWYVNGSLSSQITSDGVVLWDAVLGFWAAWTSPCRQISEHTGDIGWAVETGQWPTAYLLCVVWRWVAAGSGRAEMWQCCRNTLPSPHNSACCIETSSWYSSGPEPTTPCHSNPDYVWPPNQYPDKLSC